MATLTLDGVSALNRRIREIEKSLRDSLSTAMEEEMEQKVAERARNEFVPVGLGKLRDSIHVEKARVEQGRTETGQYTERADLVVRVVAGSPDIDHAVSVHETPSEYDPPTWRGVDVKFKVGGAKYIEKPLLEAENGLAERLAGKMKLG